jgi:adenine-specific DNA methylase
MRRSPLTSRSGSLVCPFCESGELEPTDRNSARCISCGRVSRQLILETLRQRSQEKRENMTEQPRQLTAVSPLGGDGQRNPATATASHRLAKGRKFP